MRRRFGKAVTDAIVSTAMTFAGAELANQLGSGKLKLDKSGKSLAGSIGGLVDDTIKAMFSDPAKFFKTFGQEAGQTAAQAAAAAAVKKAVGTMNPVERQNFVADFETDRVNSAKAGVDNPKFRHLDPDMPDADLDNGLRKVGVPDAEVPKMRGVFRAAARGIANALPAGVDIAASAATFVMDLVNGANWKDAITTLAVDQVFGTLDMGLEIMDKVGLSECPSGNSIFWPPAAFSHF